jgi:DNA-directed RNA polymerase subunit M/transcription elongation factor TFIIS
VVFDFISLKQQEIDKEINGIYIKALLVKDLSLVNFKATINSDISLACDRCLDNKDVPTSIKCNFKIANKPCDEDEVMYEFIDNKINIDFIIESEINAIKSDYYICDKCKNNEEFEYNIN